MDNQSTTLSHALDVVLDALAVRSRLRLREEPNCHFSALREYAESCPVLQAHLATREQDLLRRKTAYQQLLTSIKSLAHDTRQTHLQLIVDFLQSNPWEDLHYQLQYQASFQAQLGVPKVSIIGAGLSGLLAALILARQGVRVVIHEARPKALARLRPQNISFKEAEKRLKFQLGLDVYNECFKRGGALDGTTGKLRLTVGSFQDIILEALMQYEVPIHYESKMMPQDCLDKDNPDLIIIAAGVHSCERMQLHEQLQPINFSKYNADGHSALFVSKSNDEFGYFRGEGEGYDWYRENKTVASGAVFANDIQRILDNPKFSDDKASLLALKSASAVDYTFTFGNATSGFKRFIEQHDRQAVLLDWFTIKPMLTTHTLFDWHGCQVLVIGDANGSAHPLAAIGTLKFIRNMDYLSLFVYLRYGLAQLLANEATDPSAHNLLQELLLTSCEIYDELSLNDSQQVLFENILACVFSEPRVSQ